MPEQSNTIPLRSEEVQEILTAIPNWMIRWGNTLVFVLIIGLLAITWFVKYPDMISAEAMITTQIPPQKEYAKIAGQIDTFLVRDNQLVKANTPLAIIENTANFEEVFLLKSIVDTVHLRSGSFEFPTKQIPFLFLGDIAADFALFQNSYDQYLLNRQWQPFSNEALANQQTIAELKNRLEHLNRQQALNTVELDLKEQELGRFKKMLEEGLVSKQEYDNKRVGNIQAKRMAKERNLAISQIQQSINEANLAAKNTTINQSKEEQMLLRNVIQSFHQLKKSIKDWELKYVLKSSIAGQVSFLDYWTENQTIKAGDLVFTVIPQANKEYLARLRSPGLNAGKIKKGQTVNIRLENYPDTEYGLLKGKIKKISLITDEKGFYIIEVTLPPKLVTTYGKEIDFKQEMQGVGEIVTEELRLMERFFYQFKKVFRA